MRATAQFGLKSVLDHLRGQGYRDIYRWQDKSVNHQHSLLLHSTLGYACVIHTSGTTPHVNIVTVAHFLSMAQRKKRKIRFRIVAQGIDTATWVDKISLQARVRYGRVKNGIRGSYITLLPKRFWHAEGEA